MGPGVPLALLRANATSLLAGRQHTGDKPLVRTRAPGADLPRRKADVCAVKAGADALCQLLSHLFAQASVSAGATGLRTIVAFFDTLDEYVICSAADVRVHRNDLVCVHCRILEVCFLDPEDNLLN